MTVKHDRCSLSARAALREARLGPVSVHLLAWNMASIRVRRPDSSANSNEVVSASRSVTGFSNNRGNRLPLRPSDVAMFWVSGKEGSKMLSTDLLRSDSVALSMLGAQ